MAQDFAKKRKAAARKRPQTAARGDNAANSSPWKWFFSGMICGVFLAALVWLASQQPEVVNTVAASVADGGATADGSPADGSPTDGSPTDGSPTDGSPTDGSPNQLRFDFYTLLPAQTIDVEVDPAAVEQARANPSMDQFLLQAGSFKLAEDADRRRAQLLLLGLEAKVEETRGDTGRWFRVYIGPFATRSRLAKARSLTAQQGIDTLLLKRPAQG